MTEKITREEIEEIRRHGCRSFDTMDALCTLALQALAMQPETYADWQQKRGLLADKVDWAINEYDEYMLDDDYEAQPVLDRIIKGLRQARDTEPTL